MTSDEKIPLLDSLLMRAAEMLGDITSHVFSRYYAKLPQAAPLFDGCFPGYEQALLEGLMVEQVLDCVMRWFDSRGEIEITLMNTIPHHLDTLNVPPEHFAQLVEAVFDTLAMTIPDTEPAEREVLDGIRKELIGVCREAIDSALHYAEQRRLRRSA